MLMDTSIAPGSTILVSGAAGYVGSAVAHQLLEQGFKVRATTRTLTKLDLFKDQVDKEFGLGRLEPVEVKDLSKHGALDESLKGVSGFIHVASDLSFGHDLDKIVGEAIAMMQEVLKSVKNAPNVKSLVCTSSRGAAFRSDGKPKLIDSSSWNTNAEDLARSETDPIKKSLLIYASAKVAAEKALWRFVEEEKPEFRVNSVLPDLILGKIHNPAPGTYSSASMLKLYAEGKPGFLEKSFPTPSFFVDVSDTAKIHVAALLDESVDKQRLWAASEKYSAVALQDAVKAVRPDLQEKDLSQYPKTSDINIIIDDRASRELVQKHYGHTFKSLRDSIAATLHS